jgi:hypothetical protein
MGDWAGDSLLNSMRHVSGMHPRVYVQSLKLRITHQISFLSWLPHHAVRPTGNLISKWVCCKAKNPGTAKTVLFVGQHGVVLFQRSKPREFVPSSPRIALRHHQSAPTAPHTPKTVHILNNQKPWILLLRHVAQNEKATMTYRFPRRGALKRSRKMSSTRSPPAKSSSRRCTR